MWIAEQALQVTRIEMFDYFLCCIDSQSGTKKIDCIIIIERFKVQFKWFVYILLVNSCQASSTTPIRYTT
ncbi:hypothetical protein CSQ92_04250 [Janthinobacterium sp. BJB446]|nr:hypothetical protein CSQ92_04250 [Janthinobacterium sp. BJB446]